MSPSQLIARVALGVSLLAPLGAAQTGFSTLYSFTGQNGDGGEPNGILAIGKNGVLYGTTAGGGSGPCSGGALVPAGCGTVFELIPPAGPGGAWTESVLYRFAGENGDGWSPYGGVVIGSGGRLYGTTLYGGYWGYGAVFELMPPSAPGGRWTETVLHSFSDQNGDGIAPAGTLAMDKNGRLYGLTTFGGSSNYGTVYSLTPPRAAGGVWTENVVHSFKYPAFYAPQAYPADMGLIVGDGENLYGATPLGGRWGYGAVFGLTPPQAPGGAWTETDLFSFNYADGAGPRGGIVAGSDGALYGSTYTGGTATCGSVAGCGTVFQLEPPAIDGGTWRETVICDLESSCGGPSTSLPETNVVLGKSGVVYGSGLDVLFALQPPATPGGAWTESTIYNFSSGSSQPSGLAISADGALFGTTMVGGLCNYCGSVFRWAP